ncbi:MAG: S41 family peptidase [Alphaproteobacteria bacterium]|nr:S41 family peptidase [Alphaproteobacteria bacterium]
MRVLHSAMLLALVLAAAFGSFMWQSLPLHAQEEPRTAGAQPSTDQDYSDTYRQLDLFGDVFERVRAQYVEEVDDKTLVETAINGMLTSLDPHSSYLDEDKFGDMQVDTRGEFGGLGIEVTMENGVVKVVSPIDDTPAFRAGVQAGDYIVQIDGEPVMGLTLGEAVDKMRGKVGTEIELLISREGAEGPIEMTLVRDVIKIRSVRHRVEGKAGYIRITTFNQNAESGVRDAIQDINEQLGPELTGYVLDLRNNPGGLLNQAIAVADIFLDKGEIVSTRGRHESDTKRDNATPGDMADGLPIVVLINGGSASASEIVAGALQDHRRTILLGTKSFGKGSVQTVIPLPGHGAMRLTTARYYTPSGRSIQAKGIEPDIEVEPAKIESFHIRRIRESDLKGALDNDKKGANDNKDKDENKAKSSTEDGDNTEEEEVQDYQLIRALDLLNGLSLYGGQHADRASETAVEPSAPESTQTQP